MRGASRDGPATGRRLPAGRRAAAAGAAAGGRATVVAATAAGGPRRPDTGARVGQGKTENATMATPAVIQPATTPQWPGVSASLLVALLL